MSKNKWMIGGVLLVSLVFTGAVWLWDYADNADTVSSPPPSPKLATRSATRSSQPKPGTVSDTTSITLGQATAAPPAGSVSPVFEIPAAGNFGALTVKRAEFSLTKLAADIEEQQARLRKAQGATQPAPVIVSSAKTPEADLILPDLSSSAKAASPVATHVDSVVGVQGVDGKLTATIRSKGKLVTVRLGQAHAGGVISGISREGVSIRQGGSTRTLSFE